MLSSDILPSHSQSGSAVLYVEPECFGEAFMLFTELLRNTGSKAAIKLFIDGASGSGKTRMALELFLKLDREKGSFCLQRVGYVAINMMTYFLADVTRTSDETHDVKVAVSEVLPHLADKYAKRTNIKLADDIDLLALVNSVLKVDEAAEAGARFALVFHVDEFQVTPNVTRLLLRAIYKHNTAHPTRLILPVCTGLYADNTFGDEPLTGAFRALTLPYFKDDGESYAIVHSVIEHLVVNTALPSVRDTHYNTLRRKADGSVALPDNLPKLVKYLVEDTGGWPMACAQLGVELAPFADDLEAMNNVVLLKFAEGRVFKQLKYIYQREIRRCFNASPVGRRKLVLLAMSPHKVWDGVCLGSR